MITKEKYFDLLTKSLSYFFKEMYGDELEEFVCGYLRNILSLDLTVTLKLWRTSYSVTIQINPLWDIFCMVLCIS